jgi:putative heme iron utilization protein
MAEAQERDFYAEARDLIQEVKAATLATCEAGIPHAALVTVAFMPDGAPLLLLSQLAVHTRHLLANPACALLFIGREAGEADGAPAANPQTTKRLCLTGIATKSQNSSARAIFLERHPYASLYADFGDFAFWQVSLTGAYYVGGFGAARNLEVAKFYTPR